MLFKAISAVLLLSATTLASPLALVLDRRDCPAPTVTTATQYLPTPTSYFFQSVFTQTQTQTIQGEVTATKTTRYTWTDIKTKTVYSPAVSTVPVTTIYSFYTAPATATSFYGTIFSTTTIPAPDPCFVVTCTKTVSPTSVVSITNAVGLANAYSVVTLHDAYSTIEVFKTSTTTITTPKSIKVLSTSIITYTYSPVVFTVATAWKTAYSAAAPVCT